MRLAALGVGVREGWREEEVMGGLVLIRFSPPKERLCETLMGLV